MNLESRRCEKGQAGKSMSDRGTISLCIRATHAICARQLKRGREGERGGRGRGRGKGDASCYIISFRMTNFRSVFSRVGACKLSDHERIGYA